MLFLITIMIALNFKLFSIFSGLFKSKGQFLILYCNQFFVGSLQEAKEHACSPVFLVEAIPIIHPGNPHR